MTKKNTLTTDKVIPQVQELLVACALSLNIEILSVILFGSRASGDRNSLNDYEFLVLLQGETSLENYIRFNNTIRLELLKEKINKVKILAYTPQIFENVLFNDIKVGTYLYIICKNHIIVFDKANTFLSILSRLTNNTLKPEEKFLEQCIVFANDLGSEKWERKWEKALLQIKYNKKRKTGLL